jgi:hypothetical protein
MGSLYDFNDKCKNLQTLKDVHNSTVFVETGCFRGNSLSMAVTLPFEKFYSCDIDKEMVEFCLNRFSDKPIEIYNTNSIEFLKTLLPALKDVPSVMFYLDAHLPEHDKTSGEVLKENELNFPLEEELELISSFRKNNNDIIIIDDLRIYEDGPFEGGVWKERSRFNLSFDFIHSYGYDIKKFYSQEGYILLTKNYKYDKVNL